MEKTEPPNDAEGLELSVRLAELERRLTDTQALVARTYERLAGEDDVVRMARQDPDFDVAWQDDPLVSVRIATYNGVGPLLDRTIPSLLSQTHVRWQALVVGDATADDTGSRIEALGDERIRFHNLPVRGPYPEAARDRWYVAGIPPLNYAMQHSTGQWLATLDHDDTWEPDHLHGLLQLARETRAEVVYGRIEVRDTLGGGTGVMGAFPPVRGQFGFLGALVHRSLRSLSYDMACRFAGEPGDWNLARRLWVAGARFAFLDRVVATQYFEHKPGSLAGDDLLLAELRGWAAQVSDAKDYWQGQAASWQAAAQDAIERVDDQAAELAAIGRSATDRQREADAQVASLTEERDRWRATAEESGLRKLRQRFN